MILTNSTELLHTEQRLRELKARYESLRLDSTEDPRVRKLTMLSLKRLINQLTKEITRFASRVQHV